MNKLYKMTAKEFEEKKFFTNTATQNILLWTETA